jgi:hypothetical protein
LLYEIFTQTCDLSSDGTRPNFESEPKCPSCGSRRMASWGEVVPLELWPLPEPGHNEWFSRSEAEREETIRLAIARYVASKPG